MYANKVRLSPKTIVARSREGSTFPAKGKAGVYHGPARGCSYSKNIAIFVEYREALIEGSMTLSGSPAHQVFGLKDPCNLP